MIYHFVWFYSHQLPPTRDLLLHRGPQTRPPCQTHGLPLAHQLLEQQEHPHQQQRAVPASLSGEGLGKGSSPELELELGLGIRHSSQLVSLDLDPSLRCHLELLM